MDLKRYLWLNRLTQHKFSKITGITRQSINAYIQGYRIPRYPVAIKIEQATKGQVTVMELLSNNYSTEESQENWINNAITVSRDNEQKGGSFVKISL